MTATASSNSTVQVPLETFKTFVQAIAREDLWDDLETRLRSANQIAIPMPEALLDEILVAIDEYGRAMTGGVDGSIMPRCPSHTPHGGGGSGPVTPTPMPPDGGAPDGGAPHG